MSNVTSLPVPATDVDDQFRVIFDAVNDGIFISDPANGQFTEINEPGCLMFGYPKSELLGQSVEALSSGIHPHTEDMAIELNERARLGVPQIFEWQCKKKDGTLFPTEISLRYTELGGKPAIIAIFRDIAERKRLDAQIVYMAQHDVLTGLPNRSMFTAALDQAIAQSLRSGKKFAILSLDLDHFKDVNDIHGHLAGDRLLRLVAERLQSAVRVNEIVARFGGDEFAILLSNHHSPEDLAALSTRLITSIAKPFLIDRTKVYVGLSIGVAVYGEAAQDAETLLSHADTALYRAKADGKQNYRFFSEAMNREVRSRVQLTDELRLAIPERQLFLEYQPQVNARDGRIIGVEALVRWRHPRRGVLTPEEFLPAAEASGLMGELGQWVLLEACRQAKRWIDADIAPSTISVNLSTAEFKEPQEFEGLVLACLKETQLPPHMLELEITENTLINLSPQHVDMVQRLRIAGVRFALDDFGTGYSSLNYLRRFSIDRIKIAQEFIAEIATSADALSIVKLILGLSRNFGNEVIAEGVESQHQMDLLLDLDCRDVQGFFFARPMSQEATTSVLRKGTINPKATASARAA